jgi:hypothetical protein
VASPLEVETCRRIFNQRPVDIILLVFSCAQDIQNIGEGVMDFAFSK